MVRQASLFSQLLQQVPRSEFDHLVRQHGAEKGAKWLHPLDAVRGHTPFCHLGRVDSLCEICHGLACCIGKLGMWGFAALPSAPPCPTPTPTVQAALFEALFWHLAERLRQRDGLGQRKTKFRFKNKLLSLDSTTIPCACRCSRGPASVVPRGRR